MRLVADGMSFYDVTPEDVLWLSRAVEAEGPVRAHVAACLINGYAFVRSRRKYSGDLTKFVRSYAQPVNPRWFRTGDLFLLELNKTSEQDEREKMLAQAHKREHVHSVRTKFQAMTRVAVADALAGKVPIPRGATDYAAPWIDATHKGYSALEPVPTVQRNRLWSRRGAESWQGYRTEQDGSRLWMHDENQLFALLEKGGPPWPV